LSATVACSCGASLPLEWVDENLFVSFVHPISPLSLFDLLCLWWDCFFSTCLNVANFQPLLRLGCFVLTFFEKAAKNLSVHVLLSNWSREQGINNTVEQYYSDLVDFTRR
jgi:hypothetical protein